MEMHSGRGGDGGAHVEHSGVGVPTPSGVLTGTYDDFIERQRESALRTLREALQSEIACLFNRQDRMNILRVQRGWMPSADTHWDSIMTTASFLDHQPTEKGEEARENRDRLIADIEKTHARLSVLSEPDPDETPLTEEEIEKQARYRKLFGPRPPTERETLQAQHTQHCIRFPWITFRLGFRKPPVEIPETLPVQAPRDEFTLMSCRKARGRAKERGHEIDPRWAASLDRMYQDVTAEIGLCPPMVNARGKRVYTIDRIRNTLGYRPGNVRWSDKIRQRENQERMR